MKQYLKETKEKVMSKKAEYFVCVKGDCVFESSSITECKKVLLKEIKKGIEEDGEYFCVAEYFVGMYNIDIF